MSDIAKQILAEKIAITNAALMTLLPDPAAAPFAPNGAKAMNYAVFAGGGGKRTRVLLTHLTGQMLGTAANDLVRPAAAIEMMHAQSLILDDIQDDNDMRRGEPTTHIVYGINNSLLASARLLATGVAVLVDETAIGGAMIADRLDAMGAGQEADIASSNWGEAMRTEAGLHFIYDGKAGALIELAMLAGAGKTLLPVEQTTIICHTGRTLGRLLQAADDYAEVHGDAAQTGKPVGKDRGGKLTFTELYDREEGHRRIQDMYDLARENLQTLGGDNARLFIGVVDRFTRPALQP